MRILGFELADRRDEAVAAVLAGAVVVILGFASGVGFRPVDTSQPAGQQPPPAVAAPAQPANPGAQPPPPGAAGGVSGGSGTGGVSGVSGDVSGGGPVTGDPAPSPSGPPPASPSPYACAENARTDRTTQAKCSTPQNCILAAILLRVLLKTGIRVRLQDTTQGINCPLRLYPSYTIISHIILQGLTTRIMA